MIAPVDYYALLRVGRTAAGDAIRVAFLEQAKHCHPDLSPGPVRLDRFLMLREAYACLRDPVRRALYDQALIANERQQYRQIRRARRRLGKRDHLVVAGRKKWAMLIVLFASGTLAASACYLAVF